METKTKYTWYPENCDTYYDTYSSIEECISAAQKEYNTKTGNFYGCDNRYSPIIIVGIVEKINPYKLIEEWRKNIEFTAFNFVDNFNYSSKHGSKEDTKCYFDKEKESFVNDRLIDIYNCLTIYPYAKTRDFKDKYDLLKQCWILEDDIYKV